MSHPANPDTHRRDPLKARARRLRRRLRGPLSRWLAKRIGARNPYLPGQLENPRRILVCRLNRRLGNMLFVTPLVRSLAETYPTAEIDIVVREAAHEALFRTLPGVTRVHRIPKKPAARPLSLARFVRGLRDRQYDLAIDPQANSTGNRILLSLSGARQRLGFAGPKQWAALTHAVTQPQEILHAGLSPLELLKGSVPAERLRLSPYLEVRPDPQSARAGQELLRHAFGGQPQGPVVGFFRGATGQKRLDDSWWREWVEAMRRELPEVQLVELVPPGRNPALAEDLPSFASPDLMALAAALGELDLFFAADGGPMHLAAAAGVPTVGLFRHTRPARYGPLCRHGGVLSGAELTPQAAAEAAVERLTLRGSDRPGAPPWPDYLRPPRVASAEELAG